ncbi:3-keto-disaccharide hydrolase [Ereboglobus luteus]|uniref:3-keto-alpha-glucoside-1,2-lyase/3-keto-2-hydroxy-glucal hydratase domain-containing protein n=1 Tax=Ereboglobus luteus TaxID=1796921 RepID=A0A2U8E0C0_9BACT|nr:DUF1080 domain-containing protein [Ereboglobus luteus]AWI08225.1 hypothetical protein CKA38_02155 [Ereboglobus luteus]
MRTSRLVVSAGLAAALILGAIGCSKKTPASIHLFNGKDLAGWTAYAKGDNPDAAKTWGVANGVITDTGKPAGYLRTAQRYSNYRLTVEWRWLEAPVDAKGKIKRRNSGVLLHMQDEDAVWPKSIEAQLMEGNAGDFWIIGGVDTNEHKAARETAVAAAGDDEKAKQKALKNRRLAKKSPSSEKPAGEWNTYEIVCAGDTVTITVNGVEQNRVTGVTVSEGHICLQSEGAPMEFRNVILTPLK